MAEIIYVLTNEAMPGIVKIGLTTDSIESRISQLSSSSGVPLAFECYFAAEVKDCSKLEKKLHQLFADARLNPKREFFSVEPEKVVLAISIGDFTEVTPGVVPVDKDEKQALEKAKARRSRLTLSSIGISPGEKLTFSRDENIEVTVSDDGKRVLYKEDVLSLSAAAVMILQELGYKSSAANGSDYWMFQGELLDERRRRLDNLRENSQDDES